MGSLFGKVSWLTEDEMRRIHETALRILESVGMKIDHERACELLRDAGCRVDMDTRLVRFPQEIVEAAVSRMRKQYASPEQQGLVMPVRYSRIAFSTWPRKVMKDFSVSTGGFTPFYLDPDEGRRYATLDDVRKGIRLADALEHIDYIGLPCSAQEIPHSLRPVKMCAELIKSTGKIGGIEAWTREDVRYITRMAEVVAGGREALRKKPRLIGYAETRTPLCFDGNMVEVFLAYIEEGIPQSVDTMPCAGTTAPASGAGVLALGAAETLSGLVLGYAADPNARLSLDICPSYTDMRRGSFSYAGPDRLALLGATVQLLQDFYGCPGGVHGGKTDACFPGAQSGIEKGLSMIVPVMAGAFGIGTCGHVENAVTFSPVQLVIDNEIAGCVRRIVDGFAVNDETLAFDVVKEVGVGGEFISHAHTLDNYQNEFHLSKLFERFAYGTWEASELKGIEQKAAARARDLMARELEPVLSAEQEAEIDAIVEEAEAKIGTKAPVVSAA